MKVIVKSKSKYNKRNGLENYNEVVMKLNATELAIVQRCLQEAIASTAPTNTDVVMSAYLLRELTKKIAPQVAVAEGGDVRQVRLAHQVRLQAGAALLQAEGGALRAGDGWNGVLAHRRLVVAQR